MFDRIILHLGTPKTGTTGLQQYLSETSDVLAEKGVHYVKSFRRGPSHNYLMRLLRQPDKEDFIQRKLNQELQQSSGETAVISTETAYGVFGTSKVLAALKPDMRERVQILCYARRQDLFLEAMAKQKAKNALFDGSLQAFCAHPKQQKKASYLAFANQIAKRFPEVRIHFRAFDRSQLEDGDVVQDFCAFAGLATEDRPENRYNEANRTPSLQVVEAVRNYPFDGNVHRRATLREIMKQDKGDYFRSRDVMPPDMREQIIDLYAKENRELFRRYGDGNVSGFAAFDPARHDNHIGDTEQRTTAEHEAHTLVAAAAATCALAAE
ncbi:hypothetical protein FDP25_07780 [Roseovarius sp. A21]|uniref:Sulfotransferase family protein n=1 Tax=Roseovarius bejariae TaxID=2576383 RepID=A0A844CZ73_9RHOB|nr:hypothetical protein [Roseovarius bejariae]MRU15324.1 hypothetical protein [Roseovarius bejariae]